MLPTSPNQTPDLAGRIASFQEALAGAGLKAALVFQSRDRFYYTGSAQPGWLVVTREDYRLLQVNRSPANGAGPGLDQARIKPWPGLEAMAGLVRRLVGPRGRVGTELDLLPANRFKALADNLGGLELTDCSPLILKQRMLKDPFEIRAAAEAGRIIDAGAEAARRAIRPGLSELDLAAVVEEAQRRAGHEGAFFIRRPDFFMSRGPLASGGNLTRFSGEVASITGVGLSPALPLGPSRRRLKKGDLVLIDVPVMTQGYHADLARTFHLGPAPARVREMDRRLMEIYEFTLAGIRPGLEAAQVMETAWAKAREVGAGELFLAMGPGLTATLIGHGVGLEVNEPPLLSARDRTLIRSGFILALEMHLAGPQGLVVKMEDTFLVGDKGVELLTRFPRGLIEV